MATDKAAGGVIVPLLVALDEYESALRTVAMHAQLGLSAGPGQAEAALLAILVICEKTGATVADVLLHPDAVSQACMADLGPRAAGA